LTQLIGPDGLEADAVVPQCVDNQYVSDHVFNDMMNRGVDYEDQKVAEARERDFRTEFIRSLVYSSQVILQRAHLKNSEFLYKNYDPKNVADLRAFATLMRNHAIIPYLYMESSLTDEQEFGVRDEGVRALRALLEEAGPDIRCVRLAADDTANSRAADIMATDFGAGLTRLNFLDSSQRNAMASELFRDPSQLQEPGSWQEFERAVDELATFAFIKGADLRSENKKISRDYVYQEWLTAGGSDKERSDNVKLGRFKEPDRTNRFPLELKKYIDLVYNANLPDHLGRYTFTPVNMPSRMALQDKPRTGFTHDEITGAISDTDALEWIRRSFMARTQATMNLPLLSELTVADVMVIRDMPEWESFKDAQQQILREPLRCLDNIQGFQHSFDDFQRALSGWYNLSHEHNRTISRYCSFITLALSIGGVVVVAGSDLGSVLHDLAGFAIPGLARRIPRRVKGYAAKLMVGVYDIGRKRLDVDRSYTVELMHTSEELMRDDIAELLSIVERSESALPRANAPMADQGIQ
jgi:hypothetical protein